MRKTALALTAITLAVAMTVPIIKGDLSAGDQGTVSRPGGGGTPPRNPFPRRIPRAGEADPNAQVAGRQEIILPEGDERKEILKMIEDDPSTEVFDAVTALDDACFALEMEGDDYIPPRTAQALDSACQALEKEHGKNQPFSLHSCTAWRIVIMNHGTVYRMRTCTRRVR